ncbi:lysophospholipase [Brevibacterium sp. 5221]|uniref:Lysophospholipase n=1 Tax=Brevibacterium rongguiense TaxID=2695267 RepID=A0A6N9H698_9MICO|nr:GDSL-type esterase/lipase family protein [Brevibacterium rongguiense]MYM19425.1 lysophospholipase [Brevibacterium rongguiense]
MTGTKDTAIVVAGDELVAGHGDGRGLGWTGRVAARTLPALPTARFYPLGVPAEDSAAFAKRALAEAGLRFTPESENRLVLAPGSHDIASGLSTARSRLNLANVLDAALAAEVATFVVGPTPVLRAEDNRRIGELSQGYADVALRRGVPFVDAFTPLDGHPVWQRELAASAAGLPSQEGYGLIAWLVLNRGWFDWLGVEDALARA